MTPVNGMPYIGQKTEEDDLFSSERGEDTSAISQCYVTENNSHESSIDTPFGGGEEQNDSPFTTPVSTDTAQQSDSPFTQPETGMCLSTGEYVTSMESADITFDNQDQLLTGQSLISDGFNTSGKQTLFETHTSPDEYSYKFTTKIPLISKQEKCVFEKPGLCVMVNAELASLQLETKRKIGPDGIEVGFNAEGHLFGTGTTVETDLGQIQAQLKSGHVQVFEKFHVGRNDEGQEGVSLGYGAQANVFTKTLKYDSHTRCIRNTGYRLQMEGSVKLGIGAGEEFSLTGNSLEVGVISPFTTFKARMDIKRNDPDCKQISSKEKSLSLDNERGKEVGALDNPPQSSLFTAPGQHAQDKSPFATSLSPIIGPSSFFGSQNSSHSTASSNSSHNNKQEEIVFGSGTSSSENDIFGSSSTNDSSFMF